MTTSSANDFSRLEGKKVFVTGATGFIGSQVTRRLVALGCDVFVLVRRESDDWRIKELQPKLKIIEGDLSSEVLDFLPEELRAADVVFHLAAAGVNPLDGNVAALSQTNVGGTLALLEWAKATRCKRFVHGGSCFEYGSGLDLAESFFPKPVNEYGVSKLSAWYFVNLYFQRHRVPVVSLRPFTVYGPFEEKHRLVPHTLLSILDGNNLELTSGKQTRDFVFIDDAVDGFLQAAVMPEATGDTFNLASGQSTSVKDAVLTMLEVTGSSLQPKFGVKPDRPNEVWLQSGDPRRAKQRLNWEARTSFRDGIQKTFDWLKENRRHYAAAGQGKK